MNYRKEKVTGEVIRCETFGEYYYSENWIAANKEDYNEYLNNAIREEYPKEEV